MIGIIASALAGLAAGPLINIAIDRLPPVDESPASASASRRSGRRRRAGSDEQVEPETERFVPDLWLLVPVAGFALSRRTVETYTATLSARRPLVDLAMAGLFALSWYRFEGDAFRFAFVCAFAAVFLALGVIDLETHFLPDKLVLPAVVAGLGASPFWAHLDPWDGLTGAAVGFATFFPFAWLGDRLGREMMGRGDIKFGLLLGAVLGLQMVLLGFYLGVLLGGGTALAIIIARWGRERPRVIPFGTFLALGGLTALYFGRPIIDWIQDSWL